MRFTCLAFFLSALAACGSVNSTPTDDDGGSGADADPTQPDGGGAPDAMPVGCTTEAQCSGSPTTPYCDTEDMICVACVTDEHCTMPRTPVCDAHACRGCQTNDECASLLCGDNGACVEESRVVYLQPGGSNDEAACGTRTAPCGAIAAGLGHWNAARPNLVLIGGTWDARFNAGFGSRIVGVQGAVIKVSGTQNASTFTTTGSMTIEGLSISGLTSANAGPVIIVYGNAGNGELILRDVRIEYNAKDAISLQSGARLVADRTTITNNGRAIYSDNGDITLRRCLIANHPDDGIEGAAVNLVIENSLFLYNNVGNGNSNYGSAIRLNGGTTSGHILFSTFVGNHTNYKGIIECGGADFPIENNVFYQNHVEGADLLVSCNGVRKGNLADVVIGSGNINSTNPMFVNPALGDYSLTSGSPGVDAASTHPEITEDFNGRPRPVGSASDVGAIESF